jgi:hypothetical protein
MKIPNPKLQIAQKIPNAESKLQTDLDPTSRFATPSQLLQVRCFPAASRIDSSERYGSGAQLSDPAVNLKLNARPASTENNSIATGEPGPAGRERLIRLAGEAVKRNYFVLALVKPFAFT